MRHLIAAFLLAATFCASTPVANAESLLINAARVYRDPETPPIDHAAVLIRDGKIAAVGKQGSFPVPEGTRTSECAGGVVTAGFQNSHMHFTDLTPADANQSAEKLSEAIEQRYTRYGFTTLVDTTSDPLVTNTIRKRIERGELPGPPHSYGRLRSVPGKRPSDLHPGFATRAARAASATGDRR